MPTHMHMCTCTLTGTLRIPYFGRMFCKALRLFCLISLLHISLCLTILIGHVLLSSAASLSFSFPYILFLIFQNFKIMVKKYRSVGFCFLYVSPIVSVAVGPKYWKPCETPAASRYLPSHCFLSPYSLAAFSFTGDCIPFL